MHLFDVQLSAQFLHRRALDEARAARRSDVERFTRLEARRRARVPAWPYLSRPWRWEPET